MLAPVGLVLSAVSQLTVFHTISEKQIDGGSRTLWESISWVGATFAVMLAAPIVGIVLGLRAGLSGNRSGFVAAGVAAAMLPFLIFLAIAFVSSGE